MRTTMIHEREPLIGDYIVVSASFENAFPRKNRCINEIPACALKAS